ncbi:MAG: hypothetical protein EA362_02105 [Saprospirales bacterium]|nr:MAG: hypothetical protein EA362_02105 [Saprospirales bacterium]
MKVDSIKALTAEFVEYKSSHKAPSVYWEMLDYFRSSWDLNAAPEELKTIFNDSIHSTQDRSLWKRERYQPKKMMGLFFQNYPDFCKQAFRELFDMTLDLEVRVDRFKFYSDQLLNFYKKDHPTSIENNHYQDTEIIGLYLFLFDPKENPLYQLDWFRTICNLTDAKPIPETHDIARFYKIARILKKFLQQESTLCNIYEKEATKLRLNFCKPMDSFLPLADFCAYCDLKFNTIK